MLVELGAFTDGLFDRLLGRDSCGTKSTLADGKICLGSDESVADGIHDEVSVPVLWLSRLRSAAR